MSSRDINRMSRGSENEAYGRAEGIEGPNVRVRIFCSWPQLALHSLGNLLRDMYTELHLHKPPAELTSTENEE